MLDPTDVKIEVWPPRGGGQQCGTQSGVKATHLPSGTEAFVDCGRSQHRNKEIALDMLLTALTHPKFR